MTLRLILLILHPRLRLLVVVKTSDLFGNARRYLDIVELFPPGVMYVKNHVYAA